MQTRVLRVLTGIDEAGYVHGHRRSAAQRQTSAGLSTPTAAGAVSPPQDWWNEKEYGDWAFTPIPGFA